MQNWLQRLGSTNKAVYWILAVVGVIVIAGIIVIFSGLDLTANGTAEESTSMLEKTPGSLLWEVFVKLILVIVLLYLFLYLLRAWQGKHVAGTKVRNLVIEETVRLTPRQAIHLVKAGSKSFLIGATDQNLNLIAEIEISQTDTATEGETASKMKFDTFLFNALGKNTQKNKDDHPQPISQDDLDDITNE